MLVTVNIALRRQVYQLQYYTEGNVPEALIGAPESWTPEQVEKFQLYWDGLYSGNTAQRRHAKFVPGGVAKTFIPTKEPELTGAADEWLARLCCFAFSVSPQPFVRMVNRATAETAQDQAASEGLAPIQNWVKQLVDDVIAAEFGAPDLEFRWKDDQAGDAAAVAQVAADYVKTGIKSVNEVRAELGLEPVAGGDAPMILTAQGPVPLGARTAAEPLARFNQNHYGPGPQGGQFAPRSEGGGSGPTRVAGNQGGPSDDSNGNAKPLTPPQAPGRIFPEGETTQRVPGINPLDPKALNKPVPLEEEQRVADTLTKIENGDTAGLQPHPFQNLPHKDTGAVLPTSNAGYTAFSLAGAGSDRGANRVVVENGTRAAYYTNNHYLSFYPINITPLKPGN